MDEKAKRIAAQFPKTCTCGKVTIADLAAFRALPLPTKWGKPNPNNLQVTEFETFEYRNCTSCGTTMAAIVEIHKLED